MPAPAFLIRLVAGAQAALDEQVQAAALGQAEHEVGAVGVEPRGRFGKGQATGPQFAVQSGVAKGHAPPVQDRRVRLAVLGPGRAAHLEDVGEIGVELERQRQQDVLDAVVDHPHPFKQPPVPQEAAALQMQHARRGRAPAHGRQGPVGRVAGEEDVVLGDARTQPRRPRAPDGQGEAGQQPGVVVEQAIGAGFDVSPVVGDQEGVAVLQRHQGFKPVLVVGVGGGGLDRKHVVHEASRCGRGVGAEPSSQAVGAPQPHTRGA
ncbi:hypothetical protein D3C73_618620 [compost metagenome]